MTNEELKQLFRHEFDAYDTRHGINSVVTSMTEDKFVEVVGKLLHPIQTQIPNKANEYIRRFGIYPPSSMGVKCRLCGDMYGYHAGYKCPEHPTQTQKNEGKEQHEKDCN